MNDIVLKRSSVPGKRPTTVQCPIAQLAVNTNDEKLFFGVGSRVVEVLNNDGILPLVAGSITSGVLTTTTAGLQQIDQLAVTDARSIEYTVQGQSGTDYQVTKLLVIHDNSTPALIEYGSVDTNGVIFSLDATIAAGNLILNITPVHAVGVYKFIRNTIN